MNEKQIEALQLMVRHEVLAAVLEAEVVFQDRWRRVEIDARIRSYRYEAKQYAALVLALEGQ